MLRLIRRLFGALRRHGLRGVLVRIRWKIHKRLFGRLQPFRGGISEAKAFPWGVVEISGWCVGPRPVESIVVTAAGQASQEATRGLARPDIRKHLPQYDQLFSGFSAKLHLAGSIQIPVPVEVEVFASGRKVLHEKGSAATPNLDERPRKNASRMMELRGRHEGETAILLGNGPSVRMEDLERMGGHVTFAANRFFLAYPRLRMRPNYTVCVDLLVLKKHGEGIAANCGTPLFIGARAENSAELEGRHGNVISLAETPVRPSENPDDYYFSPNPAEVLGFGFGVIYAMMQLAVWMGIKELCLYGIDHTFVLPKDYVKPGQLVTHANEPNHFIPNYRDVGEKWAPPNPAKTEAAFYAAKNYCDAAGINIWNCTRGGKLEVFPRRSIDEYLTMMPEVAGGQ